MHEERSSKYAFSRQLSIVGMAHNKIKEFKEETTVLYERLVLDIAAALREDYRFRMQSTDYFAFVLQRM